MPEAAPFVIEEGNTVVTPSPVVTAVPAEGIPLEGDSDFGLEALFNLHPAPDSLSAPAEFKRFFELLQMSRRELQAYSGELLDLVPKLLQYPHLKPPAELLKRLESMGPESFCARDYVLAARANITDKLAELRSRQDALKGSSSQLSRFSQLKTAVSDAEDRVLALERELASAKSDLLLKQQQFDDFTVAFGDPAVHKAELLSLDSQIRRHREEAEEWKQKDQELDQCLSQLNSYFLSFDI